MLLETIVQLGARQAEPGEFTARAYFNGRADLAEAEGVAAAIAASGERELRAARQLLAGELSRRLKPVLDSLADALALVEVGIDFTEEDVSFISLDELRHRIERSDDALRALLDESARIESLCHEPQVVLVGRPNAGKSTLLNALVGEERAIVSPLAGTTRDAIWSHARLRRGLVRIIDIAGIEDGDDDEISWKMQQNAQRTIESADIVVLVHDCTDLRPPLDRDVDLIARTKLDLNPARAMRDDRHIAVSAQTGENLRELRERLDTLAFGGTRAGGAESLALNARHVEAIRAARESLHRVLQSLEGSGSEVIALELREALDALGTILGAVTPDDVLGRIFGGFCIGK
jgi:tRNA modification GTPase